MLAVKVLSTTQADPGTTRAVGSRRYVLVVFVHSADNAQDERPALLQRLPAAVQHLQDALQLTLTYVTVWNPR